MMTLLLSSYLTGANTPILATAALWYTSAILGRSSTTETT
jgi:hypothetical protein